MNRTLTRVAMATAGIMLAHQVASKAFRDAAFLTAWPVTALPVMIVATSVLIVALVPFYRCDRGADHGRFTRHQAHAPASSFIAINRSAPQHRQRLPRYIGVKRCKSLATPSPSDGMCVPMTPS